MKSGRTEPIVVFADILGFADLVLDLDPRIGVIDYAYYSATGIESLHEELGARTEDPLTTAFAAGLMRDLIRFRVPARLGLSTGTFRAVRLAQFFGTGVVRAYRAESCGLKGMRRMDAIQAPQEWKGCALKGLASAQLVSRRYAEGGVLN